MNKELMSYFKFSESDLQANRKGSFSIEQETRLNSGMNHLASIVTNMMGPNSENIMKNIQQPAFILNKAEGEVKINKTEMEFENLDDGEMEYEEAYELQVGNKRYIFYDDGLASLFQKEEGNPFVVYYYSTKDSGTGEFEEIESILSLEKISKAGNE